MFLDISLVYEFIEKNDSEEKTNLDKRILKLLNKMKVHYEKRIEELQNEPVSNAEKIKLLKVEVIDIQSLILWIEQK